MKLLNLLTLLEGPREDYIIDKFGQKLLMVAQSDHSAAKDTTQLVDQLSAIDPTNNKQYLQWITKQYLNKLFRIEDAPRIHDILVNFNQLKPRLAKKDINQYKLHDLEQEIDNIMQGGTTDNVKATSYDKIEDVEYLYKGPLGILAIPKTEAASCKLGRGTKWCTAATDNNMFNDYSSAGPLYVWIDRSGRKYQFWFDNTDELSDTYQIMDERDRDVEGEELDKLLAIAPINKIISPLLDQVAVKQIRELLRLESLMKRYGNDMDIEDMLSVVELYPRIKDPEEVKDLIARWTDEINEYRLTPANPDFSHDFISISNHKAELKHIGIDVDYNKAIDSVKHLIQVRTQQLINGSTGGVDQPEIRGLADANLSRIINFTSYRPQLAGDKLVNLISNWINTLLELVASGEIEPTSEQSLGILWILEQPQYAHLPLDHSIKQIVMDKLNGSRDTQ